LKTTELKTFPKNIYPRLKERKLRNKDSKNDEKSIKKAKGPKPNLNASLFEYINLIN